MSRQGNLDWFRLSKINQAKPNLQQFASLIRNSSLGPEIQKVPISLKLKLLVSFQAASSAIKSSFISETELIEELTFQKKVVHEKIGMLKQDLQSSMQKISTDKIVIQEKKKTLAKLKQKMKKKQEAKAGSNRNSTEQSIQSYFCPFCTRSDFTSRDQITFHMYQQHGSNVQDMRSPDNTTVIPTDLKEFVLSLKDKEIQLMEMMLNKKKEMETMQLEYLYAQEINKVRSMPSYNDRKSEYLTGVAKQRSSPLRDENEEEELRGESQHLFYQPSERSAPVYETYNYQHQMQASFYESENESYPKFQKPRQPEHKAPAVPTLPLHENYQSRREPRPTQSKNDYYNIFPAENAISQTDHSLSPLRAEIAPPSSSKHYPEQVSPFPASQLLDTTPKSQYVSNNLSWNQQAGQGIVPLRPQPQSKIYSYTQNMSDKLQPQSRAGEKKHETFYRAPKTNISRVVEGHIFNSGPLMVDEGDGSDYQDYFGRAELELSRDSVADEEIIVPKNNHRLPVSSQALSSERRNDRVPAPGRYEQSISMNSNSAQMVLLQYSKDKSALDLSVSKEKSSDLIDLTNSFSKRVLDESKNNQSSINLSDLKLSKLERERAFNKNAIPTVYEQPDSQKLIQSKPSLKPLALNFTRPTTGNPQILEEFQIGQPARISQVLLSRMQKPSPADTPAPQIRMPENLQLLKTRPGVLNEFLMRQAPE